MITIEKLREWSAEAEAKLGADWHKFVDFVEHKHTADQAAKVEDVGEGRPAGTDAGTSTVVKQGEDLATGTDVSTGGATSGPTQ